MDARKGLLLGLALGLAPGVLVAVALLGGAGAGSARDPESAAREPDALIAELRALRVAQERTLAALERLAAAPPARAAPSGSSERSPAGGAEPAPSLDALVASLDALRAGIEAESRRTQQAIRDAPALGGERLSETRRRHRATDWSALATLAADYAADPAAAARAQNFQTAADLLETYGPPTAIYRPKRGGLLYHYRRQAEGEPGPNWYFQLQDGYVVEFFLEDSTGEGE